jgi:hypothetical protein
MSSSPPSCGRGSRAPSSAAMLKARTIASTRTWRQTDDRTSCDDVVSAESAQCRQPILKPLAQHFGQTRVGHAAKNIYVQAPGRLPFFYGQTCVGVKRPRHLGIKSALHYLRNSQVHRQVYATVNILTDPHPSPWPQCSVLVNHFTEPEAPSLAKTFYYRVKLRELRFNCIDSCPNFWCREHWLWS